MKLTRALKHGYYAAPSYLDAPLSTFLHSSGQSAAVAGHETVIGSFVCVMVRRGGAEGSGVYSSWM